MNNPNIFFKIDSPVTDSDYVYINTIRNNFIFIILL